MTSVFGRSLISPSFGWPRRMPQALSHSDVTSGLVEAVVEGGEQVRLTLAALADEDDGLPVPRADRLHRGDHVGRRVRDAEELGGADLRRAGVVLVGELDGRALEAAALEFFA
jgi:hypothetical protein